MLPILDVLFLVAGYCVLIAFLGIERSLRKTSSAKTLERGSFDRRSTLLIGSGFGVGFLLPSLMDLLGIDLLPIDVTVGLIALVVMVFGLALRIWAAVSLGEYYSRTLLVAKDQKVIKTGPYSRIRHPGYLGDILLWSAFGVLSSNLVVMLLFPFMFVAIYLYRISVEERMLAQELGQDYIQYQHRTWRLVPFIY